MSKFIQSFNEGFIEEYTRNSDRTHSQATGMLGYLYGILTVGVLGTIVHIVNYLAA